jgi:hypothetical protein
VPVEETQTQNTSPVHIGQLSNSVLRSRRRASTSGNVKFEIAVLTPLPAQTAEEVESIRTPLTPKECSKMEMEVEVVFGGELLDGGDGVEVTGEEVVGLHVADLITQF